MTVCNFNYKYLKDNASPGSWRRGCEYRQTNQAEISEIGKSGVKAKVKGNFKAFYDVELKFKKGSVEPSCTCPLKEKWCKHAIAAAMLVIENRIYDEFLERRFKIKADYSDTQTEMNPEPKGGYIFHFNPKRRQNFFSVLIMERESGKVIRDIEAILKALIAAQKADAAFELNSSQMVELAVFQQLLKNSRLDKKAGWYDVPIAKFDSIFQLLSKADDVIDGRTKEKLVFYPAELKLSLGVNFSMAGNVLLSLYWQRPDRDDIIPFEDVRYFSRQLKWGRYKNKIFPLNTALSALPQNLIKSAFTDVKDADGAKFLYEELPKLRELIPCEVSEIIDKLTLEKSLPKNIVIMGLDYDGSLKAELEFDYEGTRVPYSKAASKSPYVTVKKPKEDLLYWVKRNIEHEEAAYKMLLACKFAPMQTNNLALEKENAIDFYNYYLKRAGDGWKFEEKDDLSFFKLSDEPFEMTAEIDFASDNAGYFEVSLYGKTGDEITPFDEIYNLISDGGKYLRVKGHGFAEVPAQEIFSILKSFNSFDVYKNDENKYVVKTYRAGLISEMKNLGFKLKMSRKFTSFWKQISAFASMDNAPLPKELNAELREYQQKGFSWLWFLYKYGLNGILADDMGLGKTLQALTLLQKAKEKDKKAPSLVVCPTSVVFNWENEVQKFIPSLKCLKLSGAERKEHFKEIPKNDIIITSYALIRRDIEKLKKIDFRYIILDESQNIKNPESQTAKCIKMLNAQHRLALSGTPIENKLEELWSVFDFLMPGFLLNRHEFNYRYTAPIVERNEKSVEKRLKNQIYPFILRRMKRDVAKDLPDKVENIAYCELTPEQKDFYLEVLDSTKEELFKSIAENGLEKSRMSIFSALLRLRQICCHPKLYDKEGKKDVTTSGKFEQLKSMLEEIIAEKHRILLFSQFVDMLDIIKEWLITEGIKFEYLTGSTKNRQEVVERFNSDDSIPIFLVSLKAGGTGLNLTGADYVIHYDPWWNPAVEDQATDRAYRIGQTKKVFVYRLITKNTVEEKIQKLKQDKRSLVDSVISVDRNIGKTLTYADLQDIFSID